MAGIVEDLLAHAQLNDIACVHDCDAVGNIGDHAEVMGDINTGKLETVAQLLDQVQYLSLNGNVQRGGGLVADEYFGTAGYRDSDNHALTHAAGELMGILPCTARGLVDAYIHQYVQHLLVSFSLRYMLVQHDGFHDLCADGLQRIQAGHRILHYHGDLAAADLQPVLLLIQLCQIHAVVQNGTGFDIAVLIVETHEALGENTLAGAGFADYGKAFALIKIQRHIADGVQFTAAQSEFEVQVFYGKYYIAHSVNSLPRTTCGRADIDA